VEQEREQNQNNNTNNTGNNDGSQPNQGDVKSEGAGGSPGLAKNSFIKAE